MNDLTVQRENQLNQLQSMVSTDMVEWALQKTYDFAKLMSYYRCAMMEIETKFNVLNEEFKLRFDRQPINSIKVRLKSPISIHQKLADRGYPMSVESIESNLNDIAGIRVICSFTDDVYMMAEALLKQDDITLIEKKDYIKSPKKNGYRSLHLIVAVPIFLQSEKRIMKAEIQLRTIAMDSWASLEHQLRYKKDVVFDEKMQWELRYCADLSAQLDERMDALRVKVSSEQRDEREIIRKTSACYAGPQCRLLRKKVEQLAGKTLPMTDREKLNAIVWAASQAEMSYGRFVQTLNDADKARIYREYRKHLNENETAILQRKHSSEDA